MPLFQTAVFENIERQIRNGAAPNNPRLLDMYTRLCEEYAKHKNVDEQIDLFTHVFRVLLDSMCDLTLPHHWRCLCLDFLYRPLGAIERIAITQEQFTYVRELYSEMKTLSFYFLQNGMHVEHDN